MSPGTLPAASAPAPAKDTPRRARTRARSSLLASSEPMVWLTGAGLTMAIVMIVGLLGFVFYHGCSTFWPSPIVELTTLDGNVYLGEVTKEETYRPEPAVFDKLPAPQRQQAREYVARNDGVAQRRLIRVGNLDVKGTRFQWVSDYEVKNESWPEWAVVVEREEWGNFYGMPQAFLIDGKEVATEPGEIWARFEEFHAPVRDRVERVWQLRKDALGAINEQAADARLDVRKAELKHGKGSPEYQAAEAEQQSVQTRLDSEQAAIETEMKELSKQNEPYQLRMVTGDGTTKVLPLAQVVRAYPANSLSYAQKWGVYWSRWWEFVSSWPRAANTEGGVFPAIWCTVALTLLMTVAVVPLGVLASLYLREYAKEGLIVSAVRIAVNNLAGVPSIVFGVFGLGMFCYTLGGSIDKVFFPAEPRHFGQAGLIWAALTLALLTLPTVIVATEEALAAVPRSMREGSYACGASKWQTIWRIVLPRAMPGIMTGAILAMARGAGEVAPLMLVGASTKADQLPTFAHPERSFLHLGFQIYEVALQTPDSEAARPMVYTITLLLIGIIAILNVLAVWLRNRLRKRFVGAQF